MSGDGTSAALSAGSCIHLPARLIHCLENHGPGEMQVLGVFRPAGSPAEAYYPDGSAAAVPWLGENLMPHIERIAHVGWDGNLARGAGTLDAVSGSFARLPFSLPSRVGDPGGKTSPEELLAAAHGGCLTMSLAGELTSAGTPPGRLDVACTIVMDEVEGQGHQIVGSRVEIVARVDGVDDAALQAAVEKADAGCPFSQLLKRAGAEVSVSARLSD